MAVVIVHNPAHRKGFVPAPKYTTFRGELVAVPSWIDYPAIAMTTGEKTKFKIRVLPKDMIVSIDGEDSNFKEIVPTSRTFTVAGSKGNVYTVIVEGKNKTCTCPAYQFRRSCKHIVGIE